jgi:glycosyltransferase involved in cell wall biosynthesis
MDVFALSSDWEGNPLSVMEAMASGLPIVSTAVGGVPDLIASRREGIIMQPGDVQGFSDAMAWLLRNPEVRQSLGMAAARRARENFDVSTMVRAYEELYDELVHHSSRLKADSVVRESVIQAEERVGIQSQ